jgi:cytochrome c556
MTDLSIGRARSTSNSTVNRNNQAAPESNPNAGLLQPKPNTAWLPAVPSDEARKNRAEREAAGTAITIGKGREEYRDAFKHMEGLASVPPSSNNSEEPQQSDDTTSAASERVDEKAKDEKAALAKLAEDTEKARERNLEASKKLEAQLATVGTV